MRNALFHYIISGALAFGADAGSFSLLYYGANQSIELANTTARLIGACMAYLLNRFWTFSIRDSVYLTSALRYAFLWAIMTTLSTVLIKALFTYFAPLALAGSALKLGVEMCILLTNFLFCKHWVFKV